MRLVHVPLGPEDAEYEPLLEAGHALSDDATVLCLDWYGGHGHDRETTGGADVMQASRASKR